MSHLARSPVHRMGIDGKANVGERQFGSACVSSDCKEASI